MFTTECPRCGRELDVGEVECRHCASADETRDSPPPAPVSAPPSPERPRPEPVARADPPPPAAETPRAKAAPRPDAAPRTVPQPRPRRRARKAAWNVPPAFLWVLAAFLAGVVGTALYHTNGEWFGASNLDLEDVPEEISGVPSAIDGDLEIAGVRTWWDLETETIRVRAVVINHGEVPRRGDYKVHLRSVDSRPSAGAIAGFDLRITEALAPREARDVEAELMSLAHPSALPAWTEQRIELEELAPALD